MNAFSAMNESLARSSALEWAAIVASFAMVVVYELMLRRAKAARGDRIGRFAHARMRATWVIAIGRLPGSEVLAVQTLRNSLMSSTISASTSALALMGALSVLGGPVLHGELHRMSAPKAVILVLLILVLFGSFVSAAMAMRYFNHAGFMLSLPVGSPEREGSTPLAVAYVQRGGHLYSTSLRMFFGVAPLVAGLLSPVLMLVGGVALVIALAAFDHVPAAGG